MTKKEEQQNKVKQNIVNKMLSKTDELLRLFNGFEEKYKTTMITERNLLSELDCRIRGKSY